MVPAFYPPSNTPYTQQKVVPSEKLAVNPRYETILHPPSPPPLSRKEDSSAETILSLFEQWTRSFEQLQKCRLELQKHKSAQREIEDVLKTALQSFLATSSSKNMAVPFNHRDRNKRGRDDGGNAFLSVEDQVKKKAFSGKLLRNLLIKQLGEEQGEQIFQLLNAERSSTGQTVSLLKIRKKPRREKATPPSSTSE